VTAPHDADGTVKEFWTDEHRHFVDPHFRLRKSARLINKMASDRPCTLLDVGCARAALHPLLRPTIDYFGIDIAIAQPAANLKEIDLLDNPIDFDGRRFDFVVAQGLFEYLEGVQEDKFHEIAKILSPTGHFIVTYENFDHRRPSIYRAYSNVQNPAAFQRSLEREFVVDRRVATSLNWTHSQPVRPLVRWVNMPLWPPLPMLTGKLAVEYFFVCSAR
jgi:SAM-dependent methyltransferase